MEDLLGIIFFIVFAGIALVQNLKKSSDDSENSDQWGVTPEQGTPHSQNIEGETEKTGSGKRKGLPESKPVSMDINHFTSSVIEQLKNSGKSEDRTVKPVSSSYNRTQAQYNKFAEQSKTPSVDKASIYKDRFKKEPGNKEKRDLYLEEQTLDQSKPRNAQEVSIKEEEADKGSYSYRDSSPYEFSYEQIEKPYKKRGDIGTGISSEEFNKRHLKKSIIWKEILEKPVSLR